jgi:hypothetical protein
VRESATAAGVGAGAALLHLRESRDTSRAEARADVRRMLETRRTRTEKLGSVFSFRFLAAPNAGCTRHGSSSGACTGCWRGGSAENPALSSPGSCGMSHMDAMLDGISVLSTTVGSSIRSSAAARRLQ